MRKECLLRVAIEGMGDGRRKRERIAVEGCYKERRTVVWHKGGGARQREIEKYTLKI